MVQAAKVTGTSAAALLPQVLKAETKSLSSVKTGQVEDDDSRARKTRPRQGPATQCYSGMRAARTAASPVVGFVAVIERNDGVFTIVQGVRP